MEETKFNEAKELQDKIETFKTRIKKLEDAMNASTIGATVSYIKSGKFRVQGELYLQDKEALLFLIDKECTSLKVALENLEEQFKNL